MTRPVERHQVVFLNPDLAGLFTAFLSQRAGADIAVIEETLGRRVDIEGYPRAFPAAGTFHPGEVDQMATDAGFPPPVWERIPHLKLQLPDRKIILDSDDGPGGLLLAIGEAIPHSRGIWTEWLQNHLKKAEQLADQKDEPRMELATRVGTSVAASIRKLKLFEPDAFFILFDILTILVCGQGIVQLDISDLPVVLAGFLTGWHTPAAGEQDWRTSLRNRILKGGARWHEIESVDAIQSFSRHTCIVRCCDGNLLAPKILVFPMADRYRHPSVRGTSGAIKWENWHGRASGFKEESPALGLLRVDEKRPPINDNLLAYHLRPGDGGAFTASAPVEERYFKQNGGNRFHAISSRVRFLLRERFGWRLDEFTGAPVQQAGPEIVLPGTSSSVSYPEGPLWGDDVLTRLRAADRLSGRIVGRLK